MKLILLALQYKKPGKYNRDVFNPQKAQIPDNKTPRIRDHRA